MELEEIIGKLDEVIAKTNAVINNDIEWRIISVYNKNKDNLNNFWKALCIELSDEIPYSPELADMFTELDKENDKHNTVYHFILNIANFSKENYLWDFAKSIEQKYGKLLPKESKSKKLLDLLHKI